MENSPKPRLFIPSSHEDDQELMGALAAIPDEYKCYQEIPGQWNLKLDTMLLGVKPSRFFGWVPVSVLPENTASIKFYIGGFHPELFSAYANSSFPKKEIDLFIGHSTDGYSPDRGRRKGGSDYREITKILSKVDFPLLKSFSIGTTELFCNGHGSVGAIGDITELLKRMPNLESLTLGGHFELTEPVSFEKLVELDIEIMGEWENPETRPISRQTQENLLRSSFPNLKDLCLSLECTGTFESGVAYSFPEVFLKGISMPQLDYLEVQGLFHSGETKKLFESSVWQESTRKHHSITESQILAIDVYYKADRAFVAGVTFDNFSSTSPIDTYYSQLDIPGEYKSGEFYKRELPCILKLIEEHSLHPEIIIIDGFVYLDNRSKSGLGAYLGRELDEKYLETKVIGVAKNPRDGIPDEDKVFRGSSNKPLFVDSYGICSQFARESIMGMAGDHRIPTMLKLVDRLCKESSEESRSDEFPKKKLQLVESLEP